MPSKLIEISLDYDDMKPAYQPAEPYDYKTHTMLVFSHDDDMYVAAQQVDTVGGMSTVRSLAMSLRVHGHTFDDFTGFGHIPVTCYRLFDVVRLYDVAIRRRDKQPGPSYKKHCTWRKFYNGLLLEVPRLAGVDTREIKVTATYNNQGWRIDYHPLAGAEPSVPEEKDIEDIETGDDVDKWLSGANSEDVLGVDVEEIERVKAAGQAHKESVMDALDAIYAIDMAPSKRRALVTQLLFG